MVNLSVLLLIGLVEIVPIAATAIVDNYVPAAIVSGIFLIVNTIATALANWILSGRADQQRARHNQRRREARRRKG